MEFSDYKITPGDIAAHGVQSLPDKLTGTAGENKAAFDALVTEIVAEKLNGLIDTLLSAAAAGQIGVAAAPGVQRPSVQSALENLARMTQEITQGSVADGSIVTRKLADTAVTEAKLAAGAVSAAKLQSEAVTTAKLAGKAVTGVKLADAAVTAVKLAAGAVTEEKLSAASVTTVKLADGAVTGAKLSDGSVTALKLGGDITYARIGLTPNQVRPIFVTAAAPSSGSPDGIYLVTG